MDIPYLEFGEKGKPIVFLHGWQQDKGSFTSLVPSLCHHFHLFLIDLPGFGQCNSPPLYYSSFDYAEEVVDWLNRQKLNKIILVGHSFGGKVASIIASKHPEIVSKLILIANAGILHPKPWYPIMKVFPKSLKKPFGSIFASRDYKQAGKLLPIFKTIVKEDLRDIFKSIKAPTLILWGKNDQELPFSDGQKIQQLIKNSRLIALEGDHFPFISHPETIAELINNFVNDEKS